MNHKQFFLQSLIVILSLNFFLPNKQSIIDFKSENFSLENEVKAAAIAVFYPRVTVDAFEKTAGEFFLVKIDNLRADDIINVKHNIFEEEETKIYRQAKSAFVIIALDYWTEAGDYNLTVSLIRDGNEQVLLNQSLKVLARDYAMQNLRIAQSTVDSSGSDDAYREYHEKFIPVRLQSDNVQYWDGKFIQPVEGVLTTDYGARRTVNGSLTNYRHNGLDLAAPTGTPIYAINHGKVVFAEQLKLTGNTVVIDHGLGLFSYYLHCDSLLVHVGERVIKGEQIATVGTTGFSTGAHLHFTTSYHLKNINPYAIMEWDGEWSR